MTLPKITPSLKNGSEPFQDNSTKLPFTLLDFWRWSVSDILSNATRGRLAEFLVATALDIPITKVRDEWSAWDLTTGEGIKVEVKSAAYIQSWYQSHPSTITFSVKQTKAWDADTNKQANISRRHADVYVFALLSHKDQDTIDPLNVAQWEFYVLPTEVLNLRERSQHSITLPSLVKLCQATPYHTIKSAVLKSANRV